MFNVFSVWKWIVEEHLRCEQHGSEARSRQRQGTEASQELRFELWTANRNRFANIFNFSSLTILPLRITNILLDVHRWNGFEVPWAVGSVESIGQAKWVGLRFHRSDRSERSRTRDIRQARANGSPEHQEGAGRRSDQTQTRPARATVDEHGKAGRNETLPTGNSARQWVNKQKHVIGRYSLLLFRDDFINEEFIFKTRYRNFCKKIWREMDFLKVNFIISR